MLLVGIRPLHTWRLGINYLWAPWVCVLLWVGNANTGSYGH